MITPYYQPYWAPDFLEHYGIKNQKWGVKNGPPYPLDRGKDGRITQGQKKKKQGVIARMRAEHQKKVKAKQRAAIRAEKAKQAAKEKKETVSKEELRQKLLSSTDPKFISEHMDLLETKEIKERLDRIDTEAKVKNLLTNKNKKAVDKGMEWVNNVSKIAETTTKVAGAYTSVTNAAQLKKKQKKEAEAAKEKLRYDRKVAKEKAADEKAREDRRLQSELETNSKIRDILNAYAENAEAFSGITFDFDPRTGKMTFKADKKS